MLRQVFQLMIALLAGVFITLIGYKIAESLFDQRYGGRSSDVWEH